MPPWTVVHQAPLSMGFPRQDTRMGCHFLLQRSFLIEVLNLHLLYWQVDSLPLSHQGSPTIDISTPQNEILRYQFNRIYTYI